MRKFSFVFIVLLSFAFHGCFQLFDCGEEKVTENISPDGKYTATLFNRNCGATTSLVAHINLRETSKEFEKDELNRIEDGYIPTPNSVENLVMNWEDTRTLKIKCLTCMKLKQTNWNDVRVIYSE